MVDTVSGVMNSPVDAGTTVGSEQTAAPRAVAGFQNMIDSQSQREQKGDDGLLQPVLDPGPGKRPGGSGAPGACQMAATTCQSYAEQLYDRGYKQESQMLYQGCWSTAATCNRNEQTTQSWQGWFLRHTTVFPPRASGWVVHRHGVPPAYVPNSTAGASFMADYPPKK